SREGIEFFEKHIRPLLADKCYNCHSAKAKKLKGALLLDSQAGALKGGEHGPAVAPGDLDKSLIVQAVRYKNDKLQMPPDEQLSEKQVADIEQWIRMGAPDPRTEVTSAAPDPVKAKEFWSFKKPVMPPVPILKKEEQGRTTLDRYVRGKLESKGIAPTPEEIDAFQADNAPDAFAKVVDRLLASPRYGERWGRYWLDLARYADTKGYVYGDREEARFVHSQNYRDWVIRAFNE